VDEVENFNTTMTHHRKISNKTDFKIMSG